MLVHHYYVQFSCKFFKYMYFCKYANVQVNKVVMFLTAHDHVSD